MTEELGNEGKPLNVFTHTSPSVFPDAWLEQEVAILLNIWYELLDTAEPTIRRFDVAQRILTRLRRIGNFRKVEKEDVKKQMDKLRKEYKVYQEVLKLGIKTVRPPCVDQMELIFDKIPSTRKRLYSTDGGMNREDSDQSEDWDQSRCLSDSSDE